MGAILVWLHFLPHWEQAPDQGFKLACFCTASAIRRFGANLISEILGTLVLVLVVGAIFSKAVADSGPASGLGPYLVARSSGASDFLLAALLAMRLILLAISDPDSRTLCCLSRAKALLTGATPLCRFSGHSSAVDWVGCSYEP